MTGELSRSSSRDQRPATNQPSELELTPSPLAPLASPSAPSLSSQPVVSDVRTPSGDSSLLDSSSKGALEALPRSTYLLWGHQAKNPAGVSSTSSTASPPPPPPPPPPPASSDATAETSHPFVALAEDMASRPTRVGMVDFMREKYGKKRRQSGTSF